MRGHAFEEGRRRLSVAGERTHARPAVDGERAGEILDSVIAVGVAGREDGALPGDLLASGDDRLLGVGVVVVGVAEALQASRNERRVRIAAAHEQ